MTDNELARERRKQRRLEALGTNEPCCGTCTENRWQTLQLHHPADYGRDPATVISCQNCHSVLSDDQKDHPNVNPMAEPMLDAIGHFLLGLADMLRIVVTKLHEFGLELIDRAQVEGTAS